MHSISNYSNLYEIIVDRIDEGVNLVAADNLKIVFTNKKFNTMFGYDDGELIGRHVSILNYMNDTQKARDIKDLLTSEGKLNFEIKNKKKDGTPFLCSASISQFNHSEYGKMWLSIHKDITEIRRKDKVQAAELNLIEYASFHSMIELLQKFLKEAEEITESQIGFYHFLEEDQQTLALQTWSKNTLDNMCSAKGKGEHYPISKAGVWVDCIHKCEPLIHNDYQSLPNKRGLPEGHAPIIRKLVVPVLREKKIVAILGVGNKPYNYDEKDIDTVQVLADLA